MDHPQLLQQLLFSSNRRFTSVEDQRLRELVGQFGPRQWKKIAQLMPGRTGRQCRDRYCNYLTPEFYNDRWTNEEDQMLLEKYDEFGTQWSKLTAFFPGKNANNIKNRWNYKVSKFYKGGELVGKNMKDFEYKTGYGENESINCVNENKCPKNTNTNNTNDYIIFVPPNVCCVNQTRHRFELIGNSLCASNLTDKKLPPISSLIGSLPVIDNRGAHNAI